MLNECSLGHYCFVQLGHVCLGRFYLSCKGSNLFFQLLDPWNLILYWRALACAHIGDCFSEFSLNILVIFKDQKSISFYFLSQVDEVLSESLVLSEDILCSGGLLENIDLEVLQFCCCHLSCYSGHSLGSCSGCGLCCLSCCVCSIHPSVKVNGPSVGDVVSKGEFYMSWMDGTSPL